MKTALDNDKRGIAVSCIRDISFEINELYLIEKTEKEKIRDAKDTIRQCMNTLQEIIGGIES